MIHRKTPVLIAVLLLLALALMAQQSPAGYLALLEPPRYLQDLAERQDIPADAKLALAALFFSGADETQERFSLEKLDRLLAQAALLAEEFTEPYERGNAVFELLYPDTLRQYVETSTTLHEALIAGTYNCVSSAVLFYLLANAARLTTTIFLTEDHMFCRVTMPDGSLVTAETTSPYGWDPGSPRPVRSADPELKTYAYTPKVDYRTARSITPKTMIATIASNRIVLLEGRKNYEASMQLASAMYGYEPTEEYRKLLLERVNNLCAVFVGRKDYGTALAFIKAATERYGSLPLIDKLYSQIYVAHLLGTIETRPFEEALSELKAAREGGMLSSGDFSQAVTYIYSIRAVSLQKTDSWFAAWQEMQAAVKSFPDSASLKELNRTVYGNWVSEVHNTFAAYFNSRNYDAARKVLVEALAWAPSEKRFLDDLALLDKATKK